MSVYGAEKPVMRMEFVKFIDAVQGMERRLQRLELAMKLMAGRGEQVDKHVVELIEKVAKIEQVVGLVQADA